MIETVIKCGGSLTRRNNLPTLCWQLAQLACRHRLLVVPGGGPFADTVRDYDRRYGLSDSAAHWMAILAMDQYAYGLVDLIPQSRVVRSAKAAAEIALAGRMPVLAPFDWLRQTNPLPHSWKVTSDSISAWVATAIKAERLVLLKDIDCLYGSNPDKGNTEAPASITLGQLADGQWVDRFFASIMRDNRIDLWILNGNAPHRLDQLLSEGKTLGTHLQR